MYSSRSKGGGWDRLLSRCCTVAQVNSPFFAAVELFWEGWTGDWSMFSTLTCGKLLFPTGGESFYLSLANGPVAAQCIKRGDLQSALQSCPSFQPHSNEQLRGRIAWGCSASRCLTPPKFESSAVLNVVVFSVVVWLLGITESMPDYEFPLQNFHFILFKLGFII